MLSGKSEDELALISTTHRLPTDVLCVKGAEDPPYDCGVFTTGLPLPRGCVFGPYRGRLLPGSGSEDGDPEGDDLLNEAGCLIQVRSDECHQL